MSDKDLEVLYGMLNKKNYRDLFHAIIVVTLGQGTYKRFSTEPEDKLAIEAFEKLAPGYKGDIY